MRITLSVFLLTLVSLSCLSQIATADSVEDNVAYSSLQGPSFQQNRGLYLINEPIFLRLYNMAEISNAEELHYKEFLDLLVVKSTLTFQPADDSQVLTYNAATASLMM